MRHSPNRQNNYTPEAVIICGETLSCQHQYDSNTMYDQQLAHNREIK